MFNLSRKHDAPLDYVRCVYRGNGQLEDDAAFMDKYSRQIGAFGLEAMSKLMNLKVLIVGLRCVHWGGGVLMSSMVLVV